MKRKFSKQPRRQRRYSALASLTLRRLLHRNECNAQQQQHESAIVCVEQLLLLRIAPRFIAFQQNY